MQRRLNRMSLALNGENGDERVMDADSLEIRLLARGIAVMSAVSLGILLSTFRFSPLATPGQSDSLSIELVRARDADMAAALAMIEPQSKPAPAAAIIADSAPGEGKETRLWEVSASGELVFRNMERYRRCLHARLTRTDEADCPSASDGRQMILDQHARQA